MKKIKLLSICYLTAVMAMLLSGCAVTIGVPEIKEARFDFSVTYEIDGEERTYTGVYVCEYDGVLTTLIGSSLEWKGYLEGEAEESEVPIHTNEDGVIYVNLGFYPEYFMGDPSAADYLAPTPNLFMIYNDSTEDDVHIAMEEEVIENYDIRILSYEYDDPIENTFKEKVTFGRFEPSIN
jgi:hypothetical protein